MILRKTQRRTGMFLMDLQRMNAAMIGHRVVTHRCLKRRPKIAVHRRVEPRLESAVVTTRIVRTAPTRWRCSQLTLPAEHLARARKGLR
jgi:hypothetical protein